MKRYLVFALVGPFVGGFLLLLTTTYQSGYWTQTNLAEVQKLFVVFAKTLQYSYLFGIVPALMIGAVDDILFHVPRIRPVLRMLIMGAIGFAATRTNQDRRDCAGYQNGQAVPNVEQFT